MRYEVEVGGRTRLIDVRRVGGAFAVELDGRAWHVDATALGRYTLSLIVDNARRTAAGFEVTLAPGRADGQLSVHVGSTPVAVTLNGRRHRSEAGAGARSSTGPQRVTAPMPGKVVRLLVKPGDTVTVRQPLILIEAMKMENELRASRAGTVAEVHAREGLSVDAGALLVLIQ